MMKFTVVTFVFLVAALFGFTLARSAYTAEAQITSCEGPPEMCDQVIKLKKQIHDMKDHNKQSDEKTVAVMATIAIVLKIAVSIVKKWSGEFLNTEKGKMYIHIGIVIASIIIFITTNMGMGLSLWQSILLALGGPLASYTHEVHKTAKKLRDSKRKSS